MCTRNLGRLMALAGLSILVACQPTATPTAGVPAATAAPAQTRAATPAATVAPAQTRAATRAATPAATEAEAGNADVLYVRAVQGADGKWTFHVTVQHPDSGWEDYADGWDVLTATGEVLKPDPDSPFTRLLLHPHENEQPFTRSQSGILIPEGANWVTVRAHDLVDGFGGREVVVDLTTAAGEDYEVVRQ